MLLKSLDSLSDPDRTNICNSPQIPNNISQTEMVKIGNEYFSDKWSVADFCVCVHKRTKSLPNEGCRRMGFLIFSQSNNNSKNGNI